MRDVFPHSHPNSSLRGFWVRRIPGLMGTNLQEILEEANRVLKQG